MMNILGTDISFYEDDPETIRHIDFVKMQESGAKFTFVRVGQNLWVDPSFATNWQLAKEAGIPRGSYWFYDSRVTPQAQAKLWFETLKGDYGELPLACDFEENYNGKYKGGEYFKQFVEEVRRLMPKQEIIIYTAPYYWKDNVGISLHPYFEQFGLWIANYGVNTPSIPFPWKSWLFWQFSETGDGVTYGTEGKVDLNYFNGDYETFVKRFGLSTTLPPSNSDQHIQTHNGIMCHILQRYGTKCVVHVIDPKIVEIYVTEEGFATVGQAVSKYSADGGVNGGGWPNAQTVQYRSNEVWVSEGNYLQSQAVDNRGFMNISQFGQAEIRETDANISALWNTWGFDRVLGKDGNFNTAISDRTTKDARTGAGITADGKVVLLSVEGNDRFSIGLTFPEMWSVLSEFGAIIAGNNDGGSSSACWNTKIDFTRSLILPSDGVEARVINHVLFFAGGTVPVPPQTGENMPTIKGVARSATNIKTISGVPSGVVATIPQGGWVYGDDSATDVLHLCNTDGTVKGFYRPTGEFVPLQWDCKASKTNLTVTPYTVEPPPPDPDPDPIVSAFSVDIEMTDDVTGKRYGATGIPLKEI